MHDAELDSFRALVDCRAVLEKAGWLLDVDESSKNAAKYRDGPARIVIVTHDGRGWFDPLNDSRGDVILLAQHLWGGNIGHARKALRPLSGVVPAMLPRPREKASRTTNAPSSWTDGKTVKEGSPGWTYLTKTRGLPAETVVRAVDAGVLHEGIYGTVWALHQLADNLPCGWEMRGPKYKGFAKGGKKTVFRLGAISNVRRVAVTESFIDALSLATIERWPETTVYISTGGGFGPETAALLGALVPRAARLVAATDRGTGGELLASRLRELAARTQVGFGRARPRSKDWNDQLREEASQ